MKITVTITRTDLAAKNKDGIKRKNSGTTAKHRNIILAADVLKEIRKK